MEACYNWQVVNETGRIIVVLAMHKWQTEDDAMVIPGNADILPTSIWKNIS